MSGLTRVGAGHSTPMDWALAGDILYQLFALSSTS